MVAVNQVIMAVVSIASWIAWMTLEFVWFGRVLNGNFDLHLLVEIAALWAVSQVASASARGKL